VNWLRLPDAVCAVLCLQIHLGVPIRVVQYNLRRGERVLVRTVGAALSTCKAVPRHTEATHCVC
jgi:hypothetical protein